MTLNLEKFRYVPSLEQSAKFLITLRNAELPAKAFQTKSEYKKQSSL